jgi:asparagine synthase (glutamine-hydrolysing)
MCGICGILQRDGARPVDQAGVLNMMGALRHRGPDGHGFYFDGPVGLGHTRLAIIDLEAGRQPMSNEDKSLWIVFNGEIYNYLELRRDLSRHHVFQTHSDTEVILHLYEEMGERCLERLNGMFSFAIWDSRQRRLFAARDRLGIKPFYWAMDADQFMFASEPKAFFQAGLLSPETDNQGLEEYLTFQFCLGERTMFKGVWRLEPGNYLIYRPGRDSEPSIVHYWDINHDIDTHHTEEYFADQLLLLVQDAIRLQLRSDVPVGAHLSGGMDSSTVVSLASQLYGNGFHTFTGGFREGPQYDETHYARAVAEHAHTIHHEIWPTAQDFSDLMPWLVFMMDEPAAGPGLFPQYFVSKLAHDHVKVVLGGQGGDEVFGGYARYLVAYLEQCLKGAIFGTQDDGKYVVTWENIVPNLPLLQQYQPLIQSFWRTGLFEEMDRRYFRLISRIEDSAALINLGSFHSGQPIDLFPDFQKIFNNPGTKSYFNKMTNFDIKTLLPALLQVEDRTSMSVSLESRVPLLDHRIVELVTRMPPTHRFKGGDTKRVFRESVKHLLPAEVYGRKDKMGFPVPLTEWLRGPVRSFVGDILLGERARQRGLYRIENVENLIMKEQKFGRQVWGLLCLELWFQAFIDGDGISQPGVYQIVHRQPAMDPA